MRVSIHHETKTIGLLFKKTLYVVVLEVHFTHEEQQIIQSRNLGKALVLARRPATAKVDDRDEKFALLVSRLGRGPDHHACANPGEAKAYQAQLLLALETLKGWLSLNADEGENTVVEF